MPQSYKKIRDLFPLTRKTCFVTPERLCFSVALSENKKHIKKKKRKVKLCLKRCNQYLQIENDKCSCPVVFCKKGVLKIFGKFTGKQPWGEGGGGAILVK